MRTTLAAIIAAAIIGITTGPAYATDTPAVDPADLFIHETVDSVTITNDAGTDRQARFVVLSPDGSAAWDFYALLAPGETWHQAGWDRCGMGWRVEIGHWADQGAAFTGWIYEVTRTGWFTCDPVEPVVRVIDDTGMIRPPVECAEDDPCWDCETMGNGVCGDPDRAEVSDSPIVVTPDGTIHDTTTEVLAVLPAAPVTVTGEPVSAPVPARFLIAGFRWAE